MTSTTNSAPSFKGLERQIQAFLTGAIGIDKLEQLRISKLPDAHYREDAEVNRLQSLKESALGGLKQIINEPFEILEEETRRMFQENKYDPDFKGKEDEAVKKEKEILYKKYAFLHPDKISSELITQLEATGLDKKVPFDILVQVRDAAVKQASLQDETSTADKQTKKLYDKFEDVFLYALFADKRYPQPFKALAKLLNWSVNIVLALILLPVIAVAAISYGAVSIFRAVETRFINSLQQHSEMSENLYRNNREDFNKISTKFYNTYKRNNLLAINVTLWSCSKLLSINEELLNKVNKETIKNNPIERKKIEEKIQKLKGIIDELTEAKKRLESAGLPEIQFFYFQKKVNEYLERNNLGISSPTLDYKPIKSDIRREIVASAEGFSRIKLMWGVLKNYITDPTTRKVKAIAVAFLALPLMVSVIAIETLRSAIYGLALVSLAIAAVIKLGSLFIIDAPIHLVDIYKKFKKEPTTENENQQTNEIPANNNSPRALLKLLEYRAQGNNNLNETNHFPNPFESNSKSAKTAEDPFTSTNQPIPAC